MHPSTPTALRESLQQLTMPNTKAPSFDPTAVPGEPYTLLDDWIRTAIEGGVLAPHAMTLATASIDRGPSARTLLLRDVVTPGGNGDGWLEFASLSDSPKGRDLAADPRAALVLYWREQHRQVRITGEVTTAPESESAADFLARPARARAATVAGRQSDPRPSDHEVAQLTASASELLTVNPLFAPPAWTLYRLMPRSVEFWQGQPGSPQQRVRYRLEQAGWTLERLWP
jgi:pyridoxamine 5'-phosphate oxidase